MTQKGKIIKIVFIGVLFAINLILVAMFAQKTTTFISLKIVFADTPNSGAQGIEVVSKGVFVGRTDANGNVLISSSALGEDITLGSTDSYTSTLKVSDLNPGDPIKLLKKGFNYIYGEFFISGYKETVDILFDNQTFKLGEGNSFVLITTKTGILPVEFQSDNHIAMKGEINVSAGINNLDAPLSFDNAGGLFFKNRSYLGDLQVDGIKVEAESLNDKFIKYSSEETKITNLTLNEYYIRISGKDINSRDYLVVAPNNLTPFGDVRLVEKGHYPITKKAGNVSTLSLVDLDGKKLTDVLIEDGVRIQDLYMDNEKGKLFFRANQSGTRSHYPVFEYDIKTGNKTTLTTSNSSLFVNTAIVNYKANLVVTSSRNSTGTKLSLYKLNGEFIRELFATNGSSETVARILIADDGQTVFVQANGRSSQNRIVGVNTDNSISEVASGNINLLAIDPNGRNVVYKVEGSPDRIHNYKFLDRQDAELNIRDIGENFQFDSQNNNVLYYSLNDSQIMKYSFDTDFVEQYISFNRFDNFNSIVQQDEYLFTIKDDRINILNKNIPTKFKLLSF